MFDFRRDDLTRDTIAGLATAYGTDPDKTAIAAGQVAQALTQSMETRALSRSGLADIVEIIGAPGRSAYFQPGVPLDAPQITGDGIGILSQLFGSKTKSRAVAARAANEAGLSSDAVKSMLPSIAAVLMGAMSEKSKAAFGDILKIPGIDEIAREARDDLGGGGQLAPPQYGNPLPLPGEPPRRYSPPPQTDWAAPQANEGSNKPMPRQSPLPVPEDDVPGMGPHKDNPYGDLSDILRRGGFRIPGGGAGPQSAPSSGGGDFLSNIVRNVLGNVLGFQKGGIISWIIRFILLQWGAKFLKSVLGRLFGLRI